MNYSTKLVIFKTVAKLFSFEITPKQSKEIFDAAIKGLFKEFEDNKQRLIILLMMENDCHQFKTLISCVDRIELIYNTLKK